MLLNISNIQHFSVGDGEGIRTTVFFKGCPLRCPWCHNPETLSAAPTVLRYQTGKKEEIRGRMMTAQEVLEDLLIDRVFYEESGGGVTFSGGEVMLQYEGALILAQMLKEENISLTVDTAGCVPYDGFSALNPYVSEYLYDYKTASEEAFGTIVGGKLSLVQENLRRLLEDGKRVQVRVPLIPGFNADQKSLQALCRDLQALGVSRVALLPFHRLGSGKYEAMGLDYPYRHTPPMSQEELLSFAPIFTPYFQVSIEH